ncbi:MAG: exo-alpha-sialidase [Acidobacteria bacterium]|nr:exo-alpha-sialidase [Acidobacteriota bacterium]
MWSARQSRKMGRRVAGLLGGLLVGLLLVAPPAAAAFVDPINLSNSSATVSGRPGIAVNGAGRVFAVWEEGPVGNTQIFFSRSRESCGGLEFETPVNLSARMPAGTGPASNPAVAVNDTDGVFVVWQASFEIWFSRSTDNGGTFLSSPVDPVNLSKNTSPSNSPTVAADGSGVFVAWSDGSSPAEIVITRMNSAGGFEPAQKVSRTPSTTADPRTSQAPSVAAGGGNVFVAWEEQFGQFFSRSSIMYKKFASGIQLTDVAGLGATVLSAPLSRATGPSLAFGNRILSVAFRTFNAVYHRSAGPGPDLSFSEFSPLEPSFSGPATSPSSRPGAARGNSSAMVAWAQKPDLTPPDTDIRHRLVGSTNGPEPVLTTAAGRASPAAAIDSTGRLLVAWQGRETADLPNNEIYVSYKEGTGGGTEMKAEVWSAPRHVNPQTMGPGTMRRPNLTVFIEPSDGQNWSVYDIYPGSVRLNGKEALGPTAIGDNNGNGKPDMMVKFDRGDLGAVAPGELEYPVTGDTKLPDGSRGCPFRGNGKVQIMQ